MELFQRSCKTSHIGNNESSLIEDSFGRFKVWARNLEALQNPVSRSSLDYRLRDGERMRCAVKNNLGDVLESSLRGLVNPLYMSYDVFCHLPLVLT